MLRDHGLLTRLREELLALPTVPTMADILARPALTLYHDQSRDLRVVYAPFDHVQQGARIVMCRLTPGQAQAIEAVRSCRAALASGLSVDVAAEEAKYAASFVGQMRENLCAWLDEIGLPDHLGLNLQGTAELFDAKRDLLHPTSALRYPVLLRGENYAGAAPPIAHHAKLKSYVDGLLGEELALVPDAIIVPFGSSASSAIRLLKDVGRLDPARILDGFPHPSGGNGHRFAVWAKE